MATEQINTAAFDYDMMLAFIEGTNIGKADITISEFDSDAAPVIKVGSKVEVNGSLFKVLTADETPSGYAGISNSTTFYIMYDVSENEWVFTSVAPSWNDALQGWYETGETDRYFFSMFKDSGGTLYENKVSMINQSDNQINGDFIISGGIQTDNTVIKTKIIPIGDWNMVSLTNVNIPHGVVLSQIRSISAMIRNDENLGYYEFVGNHTGDINQYKGGYCWAGSANITLNRITSGFFDSTAFNSTSFNRGWITITYEG